MAFDQVSVDAKNEEHLPKPGTDVVRSSKIEGLIRTSSGEPAAGVLVEAFLETPKSISPGGKEHYFRVASSIADEEGYYRLKRLPDGRYKLRATERIVYSLGDEWPEFLYDGPLSRGLETYYRGSRTLLDSGTIKLGENERKTVDLDLAKIKKFKISGTVTSKTDGVPLEWFKLSIRELNRDGEVLFGEGLRLEPKYSDSTVLFSKGGTFRIFNLPSGTYRIETYFGTRFSFGRTGSGAPFVASSVIEVEVSDSDVSGLVLKQQPGVRISGTIRNASGKPLAESDSVYLVLSESAGESFRISSLPLRQGSKKNSTEEHFFQFSGLRPGDYAISAMGNIPIKSVEIGGVDYGKHSFRLVDGGEYLDVEIVLGNQVD